METELKGTRLIAMAKCRATCDFTCSDGGSGRASDHFELARSYSVWSSPKCDAGTSIGRRQGSMLRIGPTMSRANTSYPTATTATAVRRAVGSGSGSGSGDPRRGRSS